jgi:hypothetical protein
MDRISPEDAFLIFAKWRDNKSRLQMNLLGPGTSGSTPAMIVNVSPEEKTVEASIAAEGQPTLCSCSFREASFQYGEPSDTAIFPEYAEGKWSAYLLAELKEGKSVLFVERFQTD